MNETIRLRKSPVIEFQLMEEGFNLIDRQTEQNSGFYTYQDLKSISLNKAWFPRLAKWLRRLTWLLNMGVPYFPDAESYKKANLKIHFKNTKLGIWLTDTEMADQAKKIKAVLDGKLIHAQ